MGRRRRSKRNKNEELLNSLVGLVALGYFVLTYDTVYRAPKQEQLMWGIIIWGLPLIILAIIAFLFSRYMGKRRHQQLLREKEWLDMSPKQFEHFVAAIFKEAGFKSKVVGKAGDDGIDVELFKNNKLRAVVQVKRYSAHNYVKPKEVRDFLGAIQLRGAPGGYFVTSSDFTKAAQEYGKHPKLKLINGKKLAQWQNQIEKKDQ